jgi:hypothetical protein
MHPAEIDPRFFRMLVELWKRKSLKDMDEQIAKDALRSAWCEGITDAQWIAAAERDVVLKAAIDDARRR